MELLELTCPDYSSASSPHWESRNQVYENICETLPDVEIVDASAAPYPLRTGRRTRYAITFLSIDSSPIIFEHSCFNCPISFASSLFSARPPSLYQFESRALLYSHSFFSPDSSASQYPCLHPGCSFIGGHANDLIPHTKKHHVPIPDFLHRTRTWRSRTDGLLGNPLLRINPNRQHVETNLLCVQSSRSYSLEEDPRSRNQIIAVTAPSTTQLAERQLALQQSWLPSSEHPCWPYPKQYTLLRRSLKVRCRRFLKSIKTCHSLIFLGFLTILGSLIPALWRSVAHNDIQGGFSLAQYILGVGVFIIGCMVAIHSRTCTCWQ